MLSVFYCFRISQLRRGPDPLLAGGEAVPSGVRHAGRGTLRLPRGRGARGRVLRRRVQAGFAGTLCVNERRGREDTEQRRVTSPPLACIP